MKRAALPWPCIADSTPWRDPTGRGHIVRLDPSVQCGHRLAHTLPPPLRRTTSRGIALSMEATPIGKSVLLVEDDRWLRYVMAELLADDGYRVREAATGTQALALVEEETPDAVVLDLNLPELSGLDVLHELRARKHLLNLPVIV